MIKISASCAARARACPPSVRTDGLSVVTTPLPARVYRAILKLKSLCGLTGEGQP